MRKANPERRESKRREILDAARRTFYRDGLQKASIAALCQEAGISPGHLYHYFDSKEAILETIAHDYLDDMQAQLSGVLRAKGMMAAITSEIERIAGQHDAGEHVLLFELLAEGSRSPGMAQILRNATARMQAMFAECIGTGQRRGEVDPSVDPEKAALVIINVIDAAKAAGLRGLDLDPAEASQMLLPLITGLLSRQKTALRV